MFCVFAERLRVMYTTAKGDPKNLYFILNEKKGDATKFSFFLQNFPVFLTAYNLKYNKSVCFFNVPSFFEVS